MTLHPYFATCGRGIEPILADELRRLGAADVAPGRGGVRFAGDRALLYRANLWLRTAVRVLWPILEADVTSPDELYDAIGTIDWAQWMTPEHTLAVDCNVRDSAITHSQYAARRVKDAICDQFIARCGRRPSVDVEAPMLGFNLHVYRNHAVLSLDSSGDSLHKRGYRPIQTKAPLNEALAAALILRTGWPGTTPLVDPMCGSGTLPIEAAWLALHRPPGLTRKRFGFMGWMDYDVAEWAELRDEARRGMLRALPAVVTGSDVRGDAVSFSIDNAKAAGIGHLLRFTKANVRDLTLSENEPGVVICNPPYGERIGEEKDLFPLYRMLGEVFRTRCVGGQAWVFTGNARLAHAIGLEPTESVPLFNGKIPCRLLRFDPR
ncbi:MAG: THUMP domain-containing protein [Gemmataceae bacterium]